MATWTHVKRKPAETQISKSVAQVVVFEYGNTVYFTMEAFMAYFFNAIFFPLQSVTVWSIDLSFFVPFISAVAHGNKAKFELD